MKKILIICNLFLIVSSAIGQRDTSKNNPKERDQLAQNKLNNFKTTLTEKNIGNFGFSSLDDLKNAALSKPAFELSIIPLDQLKNYTNGANMNSMFIRSSVYLYTIINSTNEKATNAMIVNRPRATSGWEITSMGKSKILASSIYSQYKSAPNNYFVASIPFLNLDFITYLSGPSYMMIPVVNDPQNKIEAGKPLPAEKVLSIYSIAAKKYNGLPM